MPRTARASAANLCYHVLNRGNNRASVFHKDGDFNAFLDLLAEGKLRNPMRILAYCVLPNHFHLALWPLGDGDLGRWMHWLFTAHVRRYQRLHHAVALIAGLVQNPKILGVGSVFVVSSTAPSLLQVLLAAGTPVFSTFLYRSRPQFFRPLIPLGARHRRRTLMIHRGSARRTVSAGSLVVA